MSFRARFREETGPQLRLVGMDTEIFVRSAHPADAGAIVRLSRMLALHVDDPDPGDDAEAILEAYFSADPWAECLIAEIGSEIVGFIGLCRRFEAHTRQRSLWVADLAVTPDRRGRGAGEALLKSAERRARRLGADAIGFEVWKLNHLALRFYSRFGAEVLDDRHLLHLSVPPRVDDA